MAEVQSLVEELRPPNLCSVVKIERQKKRRKERWKEGRKRKKEKLLEVMI